MVSLFDGSVRTTIKTDNHHLTQEMRRPHSSSLGRGRCQITSRLIQVICDNLATHKNVEAAAALREHGCWFLYLPPYSPDLNPIEMAFAKLKAHLRRIGARTFDQMFDALAEVCDLFTPDECWNYFREAGYASN